MEIDISNYIYLIFIVLSLVLGALGNRKKKEREKRGRSDEPGFLEFVTREMTGGYEAPVGNKHHQAEPEEEKPAEETIAKKAERLRAEFRRAKEINTSFDAEKLEDAFSTDAFSYDQSSEERTRAGDFDLRQAVIHDTILNRPKY